MIKKIFTYWIDVIAVNHFLCRLRSIATHRDHFVGRLSVRPSVRVSHSQSYVSQATHAFLRMLPLFYLLPDLHEYMPQTNDNFVWLMYFCTSLCTPDSKTWKQYSGVLHFTANANTFSDSVKDSAICRTNPFGKSVHTVRVKSCVWIKVTFHLPDTIK